MRIIGGKFKGHPLVSFKADHIRPTTDRVKESLFNIWQGEVEDTRVLDLFSGTGSLGLEALSRGAREILFVESHRASVDIIRRNLSQLKVESGVKIVPVDVLSFLRKFKEDPFDLILIDPPFTEKMAHEVMQALASSKAFHAGTQIAIESSSHERIDEHYSPLVIRSQRKYGDKFLSLFQVGAVE
jgi:16S rRNA (guanine966-N2)-methyltransferase